MPAMLKPGTVKTGHSWLDAMQPSTEPVAPLPPNPSLWDRAKRAYALYANDPNQEIMGMANPMEVAGLAPVAISLIRKSAPALLRNKLTMAIPEGLSEGARRGLGLVQDAIYQLGESHPRVMSHFRRITSEVPDAASQLPGVRSQAHFDAMGTGYVVRNKGINQAKDRALARGGAFELNINPELADKIQSAEDAMQLVGHEVGGHATQTLMDPSRADLAYKTLLDRTGYRTKLTGRMAHPSEIMSEAAGHRRAGRAFADWQDASPEDLLTGTNPVTRAREQWKAAREAFQRQGVAEGGWTPSR